MLKYEDGKALLLTIFLVLFISILGISLLTVTASSNKTTVNERYDQSLYYVAESGVNLERAKIHEALISLQKIAVNKLNDDLKRANLSSTEAFKKYKQYMEGNFCVAYNALVDRPICQIDSFNNITLINTFTHFQKQFGKQPQVNTSIKFECEEHSPDCFATINAEGYYKNELGKKRKLEQVVKLTLQAKSLPDFDNPTSNNSSNPYSPIQPGMDRAAVVTPGNLNVSGNAHQIIGNIYASSSNKKANEINPKNQGHIVEFDNKYANINLSDFMIAKPAKSNLHGTISQTGTTITASGNVDVSCSNSQLSLCNSSGTGNEITINIGSNDVNLFIDKLQLTNKTLNIIGSGKLNIIVSNEIKLTNSKINPNSTYDIANLNLFYLGTKEFDLSNNVIGGSFYSETKSFVGNGNSKIDVKGNIYYNGTSSITLSGNSATTLGQALVAPNATVELKGGGNSANFKGVILAKSVSINGNIYIEYKSLAVALPAPPTSNGTPYEIILDENGEPISESALIET